MDAHQDRASRNAACPPGNIRRSSADLGHTTLVRNTHRSGGGGVGGKEKKKSILYFIHLEMQLKAQGFFFFK